MPLSLAEKGACRKQIAAIKIAEEKKLNEN